MKTFEQMKLSPQDNSPTMIIVHHIGGTNAQPILDTSNQTFKAIQDYHISLGWENFGYHWFITKLGEIIQGRPEHYHGGHTIDHNNDSIGICLAGNFDATLPSKAQEIALKGLLNTIQGRYTVIGDKIYPHRKFANKSCWGSLLSDDWTHLLVYPINKIDEEKEKVLNSMLKEGKYRNKSHIIEKAIELIIEKEGKNGEK